MNQKKILKKDQISCFRTPFFCFRTSFSCFRPSFSALSRLVPRPVPDFDCPGPSHPGFWLSPPVPSLGKIFSLSRCLFVPKSFFVPSRWKPYNEGTSVPLSLCPKKFCCPVPLETLVGFPSPAVFFLIT